MGIGVSFTVWYGISCYSNTGKSIHRAMETTPLVEWFHWASVAVPGCFWRQWCQFITFSKRNTHTTKIYIYRRYTKKCYNMGVYIYTYIVYTCRTCICVYIYTMQIIITITNNHNIWTCFMGSMCFYVVVTSLVLKLFHPSILERFDCYPLVNVHKKHMERSTMFNG